MAEVASAFVTLIPSFRGGSAAISKEFDGPASRAGKDSGRRFGGGMAVGMGGVATKVFAPLAAAAGAAGLASFFGDAIGAASDLNEAASKTVAIFGKDGADAVQKFAGRGAKELGQTKLDVINASATFGTFGKAAGKSGKDLAAFSTGFAGLSTDLASFYNTSPEEAVNAIGAALRGEAEPIRKYGVLLDDATLRQEAMRLGLIKTTKQALTPQQKVLAAQSAIYKQTKDAQGDFGRTSGGLANQQRILSAQFSDFKTTIGQALLPVVTNFVTFLNNRLMPAFKAVGDFVRPGIDALKVFGEAISGGEVTKVGPLGKVGEVAYAIRDAFALAAPTIKGVISSISTTFGGLVTSVRGYLAVIIPIVQQFVSGMLERIRPMLPTIMDIFTQIGGVIGDVMGFIKTAIDQATRIISFIWTNWGSGIMDFIGTIFGNILGIIQGALGIIRGIIKVVTSAIKGDWSGVWEGIKGVVSGAWGVIKNVVMGAVNIVKGVLSAAWGVIRTVASSAWERIKTAITTKLTEAVAFVKSIPGKVTGALATLGSTLYRKGQELIQGLIDGIKAKINDVGKAAGEIADKIKGFFPGSPVKEGPLTSWNGGGAGKRLGGMLAGGLLDSQAAVRSASLSLASSVASPTGLGADGFPQAAGRSDGDLVNALTAALAHLQVRSVVSSRQIDEAIGATL